MNYGVQVDEGLSSDTKTTVDPESYYKHYYEAGQAVTIRSKKEEVVEDTHEEMVEKLEQLESSIQQGMKMALGPFACILLGTVSLLVLYSNRSSVL